jgi:hypothetical protein
MVRVTDKDGNVKEKRASVGGGLHTPESLVAHYKQFNLFPDARNIEVVELPNDQGPKTFDEAVALGKKSAAKAATERAHKPAITPPQ